MGMINTLTQALQTMMTALVILILVVAVIIPLCVLNKTKKRKEENRSELQDSKFGVPEENNPITEGERNTLLGMATLIKIILAFITIIVLIYPVIVLLSLFKK